MVLGGTGSGFGRNCRVKIENVFLKLSQQSTLTVIVRGALDKNLTGTYGKLDGGLDGNLTGNLYGNLTGNLSGNLNGNLDGNLNENQNGNLDGT